MLSTHISPVHRGGVGRNISIGILTFPGCSEQMILHAAGKSHRHPAGCADGYPLEPWNSRAGGMRKDDRGDAGPAIPSGGVGCAHVTALKAIAGFIRCQVAALQLDVRRGVRQEDPRLKQSRSETAFYPPRRIPVLLQGPPAGLRRWDGSSGARQRKPPGVFTSSMRRKYPAAPLSGPDEHETPSCTAPVNRRS